MRHLDVGLNFPIGVIPTSGLIRGVLALVVEPDGQAGVVLLYGVAIGLPVHLTHPTVGDAKLDGTGRHIWEVFRPFPASPPFSAVVSIHAPHLVLGLLRGAVGEVGDAFNLVEWRTHVAIRPNIHLDSDAGGVLHALPVVPVQERPQRPDDVVMSSIGDPPAGRIAVHIPSIIKCSFRARSHTVILVSHPQFDLGRIDILVEIVRVNFKFNSAVLHRVDGFAGMAPIFTLAIVGVGRAPSSQGVASHVVVLSAVRSCAPGSAVVVDVDVVLAVIRSVVAAVVV
mmetsp:Transcript_4266/g.10963  ORF Transcript_4266/g.10963 Transcript_4266/m.10963 type:complete len:283 (-) Transcript_4266:168-1016(-)